MGVEMPRHQQITTAVTLFLDEASIFKRQQPAKFRRKTSRKLPQIPGNFLIHIADLTTLLYR